MRHQIRIAGLALGALLMVGCGGGDNHVDVTVQNQTISTSIQAVTCDVGQVSGLLTAPLYCAISFQTSNAYVADYVQITVYDVGQVYQQLNNVLAFGGGQVDATVRLTGQNQGLVSGSIRFLAISNVAGDRVEAEFQIDTGVSQVYGHFTTDVRSGYSA